MLEEITGSEAWLRLIWESAPDAMALSDPDGTVLMVNPAYKHQLTVTIEPDSVSGLIEARAH